MDEVISIHVSPFSFLACFRPGLGIRTFVTTSFQRYAFLEPVPELVPQFTQLLEHFGLQSAALENADLIVDFGRFNQTEIDPAGETPFVEWQGMTARRKGDEVILAFRDWKVIVNVAVRRVFPIAINFGTDDFAGYECRSFLRIALLFFVRRLGFFEIHGGACVAPTGEGAIFLGNSGSGKTSAVLSVIETGWNFVGDDALLVEVSKPEDGSEQVFVRSARNRFSMTAHALERFPRLNEFAYKAVQRIDKWVFDPLLAWPGRQTAISRPNFLIFSRIVDQPESGVRPVSVGDALGRLMASTPWIALDRETASTHINVYRSLAHSCYSFELQAGRDLLENPSRLGNLLKPENLRSLHVFGP